MASNFKNIEKEARALNSEEKASLARILIDDLDTQSDQDVELLWKQEAQNRYKLYQAGKLDSVQGEDAMQRARERLK